MVYYIRGIGRDNERHRNLFYIDDSDICYEAWYMIYQAALGFDLKFDRCHDLL
jgi:hypothetical protein